MVPLTLVNGLPMSPRDTVVSAVLRFVLELAALFAIGAAFGIFNFLISVFVLTLFNVRGDKRIIGIQVSGLVRLMIEVVIAMLGIYSTLVAFGVELALLFAVVWLTYLWLGRARLLWLVRGAQ